MTIGQTFDWLGALMAANGYPSRSESPFNFEMQPTGNLDAIYCLEAAKDGQEAYVGGEATGDWTFTLWFARRPRTDQWGCYRQLLVDAELLQQAAEDYQTAGGDVAISDDPAPTVDIPTPSNRDYVVGKLTLVINDIG